MSEYVIEMRHITKRFPGIIANDDVSIGIRKGEVYALLGENGAGKSTLMSILFGTYEPDQGEILVDGKVVMTLKGGPGKWNQSEIVLPLDEAEAAEHTVEVRMTNAVKRFTITAIAVR